ncbi:MAG: Fe-S cluster assembly protein SufD [Spirochaetales bacterium]|nr:Fe-S cluster assembly protein SufD [Spirochaetales bacterium]
MKNEKFVGYPHWYRLIQEKAEEREKEIGWPDARQEAWRRTDLKRLDLENLYTEAPEAPPSHRNSPMNLMGPSPESRHMSLSHLSDAVRGDYPGVQELFQAQFDGADNRFVYRQLAEPPRGFYLYLPRNYRPRDLLFLEDHLTRSRQEESFTLNLVVLEEGAQGDLWERVGTGVGSPLHNRSTLILLGKGSRLNYYRTQALSEESGQVDFSRVILKEGAEFNSYQAEREIHFNKCHFTADLQERRAHAELRGIYHIGQDRFCEIFTEQNHRAPQGTSHSFYRGVLEDRARTVFNGMIRVSPEAVKTDAYLTNNNLLINDGCRADSIPGLKIATNDVKCSHGSTTGKVDKNQMFYLQSRGFTPKEAKAILTRAFLEEVMSGVPELVQEELQAHWNWAKEEIVV